MIADTMSLHMFVDASESAYGAVVYARCQYEDDSVSTNIVAAKKRVSSNIATSIPRLELMEAIVGVRLTTRISEVLGVKMTNSTFWSDSVNVLWWVRCRSRNFKPFVANRVGEIQTSTDPKQWRYVPTGVNPADMFSRGMSAIDVAYCNTWWRGPSCLRRTEDTWPTNKTSEQPIGDDEMKRFLTQKIIYSVSEPRDHHMYLASAAGITFPFDPKHYSSRLEVKKIQAWVNRSNENSRKRSTEKKPGESIADELTKAEIQLLKHTQFVYFQE